MNAIGQAIPRPYRAIAVRVGAFLAVCVLLFMLMGSEQRVDKGDGRYDKSYHKYDDGDFLMTEPIPDEFFDMIDEEMAQAPATHRGAHGEDLIELQENVTDTVWIDESQMEFFTELELAPVLTKPYADPSQPGQYGKAYKVIDTSEAVQNAIKEGWEAHAFNQYVCDKISLHRDLGDKRDPECKEMRWMKPLPTTSVIIIFHNEAWCSLMRTVYSVLETSPAVLLKEIILVDDASTMSHLGAQLDGVAEELKVVKVVRLPERSGLIRARLAGAEIAQGDVLTFLDSHCECSPHWLEPLLQRIAEDDHRVVCPVIEAIDADTFAVSMTTARKAPMGSFGWGLEFHWVPQPPGGAKGVESFSTEVIDGSCFAINRQYFWDLGGYDPDMTGIDSEDIEFSFRVWMCGGSLEINPCSKVGHIMHDEPIELDDEFLDYTVYNKMRLAEMWMDDFKWNFYRRCPRARWLDVPDVSDRVALHEKMQCGNFPWFIKNIAADAFLVPYNQLITHGEIRPSTDDDICLDSNNVHGMPGSAVDLAPCLFLGKGQYFELTDQSEIRQNAISELCIAAYDTGEVVTEKCQYPWADPTDEQLWLFMPDGHIYHIATNKCLTYNMNKLSVSLLSCVKSTNQLWTFNERDGYEEDYAGDGGFGDYDDYYYYDYGYDYYDRIMGQNFI